MKHSVGQKIQIILLSDDFKYIFEQRTTCDKKFVKLTLNPQKSYRMIMRRNLFEQIHWSFYGSFLVTSVSYAT